MHDPIGGIGSSIRSYGRAAGLAALVAMAVLAAPAAAQTTPSSPLKWGPFLDLEGKAGTKRNIGEGDLFVPLAQDGTSMLFTDIRGRFDDHSDGEGNFGLGVRHMLDSGWNLGLYGYYDRRKTELGSTFGQATFGAEALSLDWDLRANFYQPVGPSVRNVSSSTSSSSSSTSSSSAALAGTTVQVTTTTTTTTTGTTVTTQDVEQKGFDAEIGWRVPVFAPADNTQLRVYAGGYRFYADGTNATQGPRGRIDLTVYQVPHLWEGARLDLGTEVQNDGPRGTQAFAEARLRIPLQVFGRPPAELTAMERRMEDPIVRDVDIVDQSHTATTTSTTSTSSAVVETATQTSDGTSFTVLNSSTTTDLPTAVSALPSNSTIVLAGTFSTTATVDLSGNKSLMAGSITVSTPSGHTAVLDTPATISSSNLNPTIQAPGNNTISGLTIVTTHSGGSGGSAISLGSTGGNYNILDNTITMTQAGAAAITGISTDRNSNIVISGNKFTLTGGTIATAVNLNSVLSGATTATVSGNTFDVSGATSNLALNVAQATINSGSTGNVRGSSTCSGTPASGSISFTDGTTCP